MNIDNTLKIMDLAMQYCAARDKYERTLAFERVASVPKELFYGKIFEDLREEETLENQRTILDLHVEYMNGFDELAIRWRRVMDARKQDIFDTWLKGTPGDAEVDKIEEFLSSMWEGYCRRLNTWHMYHGSMYHLIDKE